MFGFKLTEDAEQALVHRRGRGVLDIEIVKTEVDISEPGGPCRSIITTC